MIRLFSASIWWLMQFFPQCVCTRRGIFIMKQRLLMAVLLVTTAVFVEKSASQSPTKNSSPQTGKHVTITGCLTRGPHEEYELVDRQGVHNLIYKSEKVNLDSYVGQPVKLVGERSAIPSTDEATRRPMPHFKVTELQSAPGKCGK
jgi:hypothetical protein